MFQSMLVRQRAVVVDEMRSVPPRRMSSSVFWLDREMMESVDPLECVLVVSWKGSMSDRAVESECGRQGPCTLV